MACPTCDRTMLVIGSIGCKTVAHCPRCGTLTERYYTDGSERVYVPELAEQSRQNMVTCSGCGKEGRSPRPDAMPPGWKLEVGPDNARSGYCPECSPKETP